MTRFVKSFYILAVVCLLPVQTGSSCGDSRPSNKYFFDVNQKSCVQFVYNGCFGNDNNFPSIAECENFCLKGFLCATFGNYGLKTMFFQACAKMVSQQEIRTKYKRALQQMIHPLVAMQIMTAQPLQFIPPFQLCAAQKLVIIQL